MSDSNPTRHLRGFTWFVSPADAPGERAAHPFDFGIPRGCEIPLRAPAYWPVGTAYAGVCHADASAGFLVLTSTAAPPAAGRGWVVEPARLDEGCVADGGNLRMVAIAGAPTGSGVDAPPECVFEVLEG